MLGPLTSSATSSSELRSVRQAPLSFFQKKQKGGCRSDFYTTDFPYCWNGQDLDSDDHFAHMAYGVSPRGSDEKVDVGTSGGVCPPSHPIRTPSLFYERFFHVELWFEMLDQALNESQPFVFSHGCVR